MGECSIARLFFNVKGRYRAFPHQPAAVCRPRQLYSHNPARRPFRRVSRPGRATRPRHSAPADARARGGRPAVRGPLGRCAPARGPSWLVGGAPKRGGMDATDPGGTVESSVPHRLVGDPDDEETAAVFDELEFVDAFGARPWERAGGGEVCCRECGEPTGSLAAHLGAHGVGLGEYAARFRGAPAEGEPGPLARWS